MHDEVSETENIRKNLAIERMIIEGCEILLDTSQTFVRQGTHPHPVPAGPTAGAGGPRDPSSVMPAECPGAVAGLWASCPRTGAVGLRGFLPSRDVCLLLPRRPGLSVVHPSKCRLVFWGRQ